MVDYVTRIRASPLGVNINDLELLWTTVTHNLTQLLPELVV